MKNLFPIFSVILMLIPLSCDKENENPVPYVYVNFSINIDGTRHIELNTIGGYAYFTGGFNDNGIIIYRQSVDEFKAYDRTCPFHPYEPNAIVRVFDPPLATDTLCGSTFELIYGSVVIGPSKHPLREYRTFYNPPILQVTSY